MRRILALSLLSLLLVACGGEKSPALPNEGDDIHQFLADVAYELRD